MARVAEGARVNGIDGGAHCFPAVLVAPPALTTEGAKNHALHGDVRGQRLGRSIGDSSPSRAGQYWLSPWNSVVLRVEKAEANAPQPYAPSERLPCTDQPDRQGGTGPSSDPVRPDPVRPAPFPATSQAVPAVNAEKASPDAPTHPEAHDAWPSHDTQSTASPYASLFYSRPQAGWDVPLREGWSPPSRHGPACPQRR